MEPEQDTEPTHQERLADARRLIEEDQQQRMQACLADIEAALDKHGMRLDLHPARAVLVPKER